MIRDKVIPLAWLAGACILIGAAAGRAHAEPLTHGEFYALTHGADVCMELDRTSTFTGLEHVMSNIAATTRLSDFDIGEAVVVSVSAVCPHHIGLLKRYVAAAKSKGTVA